LRRSAPTYGKR